MIKKNIILFGPYVPNKLIKKNYGGGAGGYTRNMKAYLDSFLSEKYRIVPSFHTIRGQLKLDNFVVRMIIDMSRFFRSMLIEKPDAVHLISQYRSATPREFGVFLITRLFNKPFVFEIKAGVFIKWYTSSNFLYKKMIEKIIKGSKLILVEGEPYLEFITNQFNKKSHYFPNFVPSKEIPLKISKKLDSKEIKILFVGYCYEGKGIFELVAGCNLAAKNGLKINLTVIGHEQESYKKWLDSQVISVNLTLNRLGRQPHEKVLLHFSKNDIYCYPTSHEGEGHNNTINEAMMMGLIIITTKHGFLDAILSENTAYFLNSVAAEEISKTISSIDAERSIAQEKAFQARRLLLNNYSSEIALKKLEQHYDTLFH